MAAFVQGRYPDTYYPFEPILIYETTVPARVSAYRNHPERVLVSGPLNVDDAQPKGQTDWA
jgi:hypothetical protein